MKSLCLSFSMFLLSSNAFNFRVLSNPILRKWNNKDTQVDAMASQHISGLYGGGVGVPPFSSPLMKNTNLAAGVSSSILGLKEWKYLPAVAIVGALLIWIRRILWSPSRTYNREENSVGREYDSWTKEGILEYYWGEHIHLGYYSKEDRDKGYIRKDFKKAKYDFIDKMMEFGEVNAITHPVKVLDVGCGIGGTSRYLASKYGPKSTVTGITLSKEQVARAQELAAAKNLTNTNFLVMDALNMTFPEESFDIVWACESGEHMPDKQRYVDEMIRVLKPGGKIVIATWCQRDDTNKPFDSKERKLLDFLYSEWTHPFFISIKSYADMMKNSGVLRNVNTADWTDYTVDSWRHSFWVGFFDPLFVILRPRLWYKVLRDVVTLERMREAFKGGLMQYGMMTATKLKAYTPPV